jgi:hypothetical protein
MDDRLSLGIDTVAPANGSFPGVDRMAALKLYWAVKNIVRHNEPSNKKNFFIKNWNPDLGLFSNRRKQK